MEIFVLGAILVFMLLCVALGRKKSEGCSYDRIVQNMDAPSIDNCCGKSSEGRAKDLGEHKKSD